MDTKIQELEHLLAETLLEKKNLQTELKQVTENREYWRKFFHEYEAKEVLWCENEEKEIRERFGIEAENLQGALKKVYDTLDGLLHKNP